jgi:hypothetical protein
MMANMYPYTIEIDGSRADDDQHWRIYRIHMIIGYAQALADIDKNEDFYKKIKSIYDLKGTLFICWTTEPSKEEKDYLKKAWESIVTDYEGNDIDHVVE